MPVARFELPSGKVARFEVPDGTTPEQAQTMIEGEIERMKSSPPSGAKPNSLLRQLGLTARHLVEGVTALPNMVGDAFGLRSSEAVSGALDKVGLPRPEGAQERVVGDVSRAIAGVGPSVAAGRALAGAVNPVVAGVGDALAASPGAQTVSAASGATAAGVTREDGGSPVAQIAAGVAGAAAPAVLKAGAEAAMRGVVRGGESGRQNMADRISTFEAAGAEPSVGQAAGTRRMQAVESGLSKVPGSAGIMADAAERESKSMGQKVDEIAHSVTPNPSAARGGAAIEKGVEKFVDRFKAQQQELYGNLDKHIAKGAQVDVSNTRAALERMNADIPGAPALSEWFKNSKIKDLEAALTSDTQGPQGAMSRLPAWEQQRLNALPPVQREAELASMVDNKLPYEALSKLRTLVGNEISNTSLTSDIPRSKWKAFYAALSQDLEQAAKDAGPNAERAFARANQFTSAGHQRIDTFLDRITGKDTVEKIFSAATNPSELKEGASTINAVMRSLEPKERSAVSGAVIKRMGVANPGNQNDLGEVFSSQTFLTNWNKISPEAKRVLFAGSKGNELRQNLDKVAEAADMVRTGGKVFSNPSGTAQAAANIGGGATIITSAALGRFDVAGLLIGAMGAANVGSRLMTNPDVVRWMAKTTTVSPAALPAQLGELAQIGRSLRDPKDKNEVEKFLTAVRDGAGSQPQQPERQAPQ